MGLLASVRRTGMLPSLQQPRVMLLDLSPTNLSAYALCGCKKSGHNLFGIGTTEVLRRESIEKMLERKAPLMAATMLGK